MIYVKLFSGLGLRIFITLASLVVFCGCQSAINKAARETKYSAYEMIGVQKRDLFKKEVGNVKEEQEDAGESFKDALEQLKEVYAFDGGNLEREYRKLNSSYEDAEEDAEEVRGSIRRLETVAQDLFAEWKKEISEMSTSDLRARSSATLSETQKKYQQFHSSLKKSEERMNPVLNKFKDQVVFLKHNLNAKAITGLKTESVKIQGDIEGLIKEMNSSVQRADEFIKTL